MTTNGSTAGRERIRVWVIDQHPIFRRGLVASLNVDEVTVVGETASLGDGVAADVDVVIFAATTATLGELAVLPPTARSVAIVNAGQQAMLNEIIERGADAILGRDEVTPGVLVSAVRAVDAGATILPSGMLTELLDSAASGRRHKTGALTDREVAVLRLLADGDDTREIAGTLSYSERTVKNVVHDVLMKMNCRNRVHAVALATRQGVI
jgi:DNA-binding NarL/FixJ family response regulator